MLGKIRSFLSDRSNMPVIVVVIFFAFCVGFFLHAVGLLHAPKFSFNGAPMPTPTEAPSLTNFEDPTKKSDNEVTPSVQGINTDLPPRPVATTKPKPTATLIPTSVPTATSTPVPTSAPTNTPGPTDTPTPTPTDMPTPTDVPTPTP